MEVHNSRTLPFIPRRLGGSAAPPTAPFIPCRLGGSAAPPTAPFIPRRLGGLAAPPTAPFIPRPCGERLGEGDIDRGAAVPPGRDPSRSLTPVGYGGRMLVWKSGELHRSLGSCSVGSLSLFP